METLLMSDFFSGANLVWIAGIISGVIAGLWAFYRFVYEKKLERFNKAATSIFTNNEDEVLAAVANLGVFKKDYFFEKNATDVLLTRLYKELNYNITNAITNALIQFSNRRELLEIANAILGINRNFFFQSKPYEDMLGDIKREYKKVKELKAKEAATTGSFDIEEEKEILEKKYTRYSEEYLKLNDKVAYELTWHKQITADTYARIIRRASALKIPRSIVFLNYLKQIILNWDFRFYSTRLSIELYQNPFAYIHLVQFKTKFCSIKRCGLEYGLLADIEFNNIDEIYGTSFTGSNIIDCQFNKGVIRQSIFLNSRFRSVSFNRIKFVDIYFTGCSFDNCSFENCSGLTEHHFYGVQFDDRTKLPDNIDRQKLKELRFMEVYWSVQKSSLTPNDKKWTIEAQAKYIVSLSDVEEIYRSNIEQGTKDDILIAAGNNFSFTQLLHPVLEMDLEASRKFDLLQLLIYNNPDRNLLNQQLNDLFYPPAQEKSEKETTEIDKSKLFQ